MEPLLIASNNLQINLEEFDLNQFVNDVFNNMQSRCVARIIDLHLKLPDSGKNLLLYSDKEMLQKVMHHLLNNAVKFTHQGSIWVGYDLAGDKVEFFVQDNGIGIGEEALGRIFEAFAQEDYGISRT